VRHDARVQDSPALVLTRVPGTAPSAPSR
jgi:hypothetical protein